MGDSGGAIGIFDSGMGGLTVARQVIERLHGERIVYLGDTARLPYGTKSPETVVRYARACSQVLLKRGIKLLVVACNTASACALPALRETTELPVLGVVEPGARAAVAATTGGRIGIVGTDGTIRSGAYHRAISDLRPDVAILAAAGRGNIDGQPIQGSLAQFVGRQADLVRTRKIILGHHDDWLPGFSVPTEIKPIRDELSHVAPRTELVELGYVDGHSLFD